MAKVRPDFSFVREGRPLSAWLIDLVADDRPTRAKAGDVLQGMTFGIPYGSTKLGDLDSEEYARNPGQPERFAAAVRDAVAGPEFPTGDFVRRLILYLMAIHDDWLRRADESRRRSREEPDEYVKRIGLRLEAAGDDAERTEAAKRLCRWFCATVSRGMKADGEIFAGAEAMGPAGMASGWVFEALDVALLADRPGLRMMLDGDSSMRRDALEALERIGPPAADFAPGLVARLDALTADSWFDAARALGSIGRDDPAVVDALLTRLGSRSQAIRAGATESLARAGPPLAGRADEAADILLEQVRTPGEWGTIGALASVAPRREDVLNFVLEMASPRPPRWVADEYEPDGRRDEVMYERAEAIVALRRFRGFADRIVPTLIEAIESFEEFDPDWGYDGAHERVCRTLAVLGPGAAAATGPLVAFLEGYLESKRVETIQTGDWPKAVFDALAGIGPAAAAALPILEALRRYEWNENPPPLDRDAELDRAILAIRGEIDRPTFPATA